MKIQRLADRAIEVVEQGQIKFMPENYARDLCEWMRNIHDWCISRQLWWGHRIPAWHCKQCSDIIVAREAPATCKNAAGQWSKTTTCSIPGSRAGCPSSALGWPENTPDLDAFYPTTLLITSFDILFFWVVTYDHDELPLYARHSTKRRHSLQHGLHSCAGTRCRRPEDVQDQGQRARPIEIIERYGTDAVRFTLAAMAAPGTDIAFSESRTESYRAFANKIWNAARFLFMNVDRAQQAGVWSLDEFKSGLQGKGFAGFEAQTLEDRWILSRFNRVAQEIDDALATYRFHEAAHVVYHFFWGEFCDWYLELIKPRLAAENREDARAAYGNLISIFEGALRLLSPFMPFITEELWHAVYDGKPPAESIALDLIRRPIPSR